MSISPNCCVIDDQKPHFLTVSDVLRKSVDNTLALLRKELEIRRDEILESLHFASLEKIFIEERIYKDHEFEQARSMDAACEHIDERLTPYYPQFIREVTKEDILKLMEIKMAGFPSQATSARTSRGAPNYAVSTPSRQARWWRRTKNSTSIATRASSVRD